MLVDGSLWPLCFKNLEQTSKKQARSVLRIAYPFVFGLV